MAERTYTLKEAVWALWWTGDRDDPPRLARQVRHWTNLGLLSPVGKRHTGTGIRRQYSANEVRKAAILVELENYRVPMPILERGFATFSEEWIQSPDWSRAVTRAAPVFLHVTHARLVGGQGIAGFELTSNAVPVMLAPPKGMRDEPALPASAIVVNVTRVFARMKL